MFSKHPAVLTAKPSALLPGVHRDELVLGIPRRDDEKPSREAVAGVPDRVSDSARNEHEAAGREG
jgi:hypothetical protein